MSRVSYRRIVNNFGNWKGKKLLNLSDNRLEFVIQYLRYLLCSKKEPIKKEIYIYTHKSSGETFIGLEMKRS